MVVYGLTAAWIFAVGFVLFLFPGQCLIGFGVMLGLSLIQDAAETRRFRPW